MKPEEAIVILEMILKSVSLHQFSKNHIFYMKYNELEKRLKRNGCYDTGEQQAGHPLWYCPKTDMYFQMSNHGKEEVAKGTLNAILRAAGLK